MALILCPECGKEVSDKAQVCIHCGFPIEQKNSTICIINGVEYDLYEFYIRIMQCKKAGCEPNTFDKTFNQILKDMYFKTRLSESGKLCKIIYETEKIPSSFMGEILVANTPQCPKCGSTAIQMVPRKFSLLTGFATNKVDRVCVNCKYKW